MNNTNNLQIVCADCHAINRVPASKLADHGKCGKCKHPLFSGKPISASADNAITHLTKNDLPVVIDFWADWCGPCKMFAPTFAQIAAKLDTQARFVKVDTEANQPLAGQYQIRSIPTLMIMKNGKETARQAGAMSSSQFESWILQHL